MLVHRVDAPRDNRLEDGIVIDPVLASFTAHAGMTWLVVLGRDHTSAHSCPCQRSGNVLQLDLQFPGMQVVMITPVAFENIKEYTYTIFGVINAIMIPSVYFFPESSRRSLEEMDLIFSKVKGVRGALDVVKVARETPHQYGRNGEMLIAVSEGEKVETAHVESD
ncbi:hypothetical protein CEP51_011226 [Fusarium floridanum]|uniref:Uncharacterized protein n=1 Tax=Fusarium floridanum TaxID=1325733 RepID=A0A428RBY9_9HYPO|nr:hypothetical protein CEP51_011226 [Fusarium floridanum]